MTFARVIKIIASICFVLLAVAVVIVWNSPATGYEASIYRATPSIFWIASIFSLICGISIVVQQIYTKEHEKGSLWVIGLILILLSYTAFLSLWIVRGYALWCSGDPATHLGRIQNVIATGHIEKQNFYPIAHLYLAQISTIGDISPVILHKYVPLVFGILFVPFMYLFAKSVLPQKGQVILATVASMSLLIGWYLNLTPNHLSNLTLPLAFFLLVKSFSPGTFQWKLLFIIVIFLFPVFHPVPGLALLLMLLTLWLPTKIVSTLRKEPSKAGGSSIGFSLASLLLFVWGITWISSFYVWDATIRNIHILITEGGLTHFVLLQEQILYGAGYGYSVAEQFFKLYGGILVLILLAMVALPILQRRIPAEPVYGNLVSLYGPLVAFVVAIIILYSLNIGFGPLRTLVYVVIVCTVLAGFMLYQIMQREQQRQRSNYVHRLAPLLVIIILIAIFMSGALKLYPSSYVLMPNWQITKTTIAGMDWFLHNKDTRKELTGLTIAPGRFADFLISPEERKGRGDIPRYVAEDLRLPYHFGYNERLTLGDSYNDDVYLILNEQDRVVYREIYPEMAQLRFLPEDFEKLEQDPYVDRLYSNGGFDTYYIHGLAQHASGS